MRSKFAAVSWRASATCAAAVALFPWSVSAQSAASSGQRVQEVDLIAELIYSSNVAASSGAVAGARGVNAADVITHTGIHFDLARPIGRETVYVAGDAGYDFYARNQRLNRENLDFNSGVQGQIGPCQTGLTGEYSRAQRDLGELAAPPIGSPIRFDQKNTLQVEQIGGAATCARSTGFGPSVTASQSWTQNSSQLERFTNAQTFSASGGVSYQRPVLGSIRLFAAFSTTDYPDRAGLAGFQGIGLFTGYKTVSGGVTYTRAVGSRLQGSASLSYTDLSVKDSARPGTKGLTYSAALTYLISSRFTASAAVSRATVPSNRLNSTYGINQNYSGNLGYEVSSRLTLSGGASYAQDNYNGSSSPFAFDLTKEKIYAAFSDATLKLNQRFSLSLDARHVQRTANFAGLSYPETRVGLTGRATF